MAFTTFSPLSTIVEPATEEKVFDRLWITNLRISADNPNLPIKLIATFVPICTRQDGTIEVKKNADVIIKVDDLFAEAAQNQAIAIAIEAVFSALKEKGIAEEKLA